jgi:1,4-alpha-glucan branching enzyme
LSISILQSNLRAVFCKQHSQQAETNLLQVESPRWIGAFFSYSREDVEKVDPDLVMRDAEWKVFTVRYEAVNAMLLNEFLKEHRTVQELKSTATKQEATIAEQQQEINALTASVKQQAAQIQEVSDQLEVSKPHRK